MTLETCPICLNREGTTAFTGPYGTRDAILVECQKCGGYAIARTLLHSRWIKDGGEATAIQRAGMSHKVRIADRITTPVPLLDSYWIDSIINLPTNQILPNPSTQAQNIIKFIGDYQQLYGKTLKDWPRGFSSKIGSISDEFAKKIARELMEEKSIFGTAISSTGNANGLVDIGLTLSGWRLYEIQSKGKYSSNYGFMALDFKNTYLVKLKEETIRPALESLGYGFVDMRDVAQAGIIDNLMRQRIRDSSFVVVDLSDANHGAYWEAGYAEGLEKPVIYICRKGLEHSEHLHFDVNHSTIVFWHEEEVEQFTKLLIATIRRSLVLFD